ncbi:MAG: hypothetical protein ABR886_01915 [Dehalococcoidales bacterium]|jgi:hypothetical protein
MPGKWLTLVIVGAAFIVLGIIAIILGMREEKRIFAALAKKPDLREFTGRHVESPQPGALKIGGWIAIALGVLLAVAAIIFWRTGWPMD